MASFFPVKMKRKDLEEVNDEFSDISLSSPARKIRRLDAELPPIMEEEEPVIPLTYDQQLAAPMEGVVPSTPLNEERALVLYKPVNTPMLQSSSLSNLSFKVNTDLIAGLKNQVLWPGCASVIREVKEEEASMDTETATTNGCLAVVPWVPSQYQVATMAAGDSRMGIGVWEPMEAEAADVSTMKVEGENALVIDGEEARDTVSGLGGVEGLQQWQQHCMTLQLPQNTTSSIMWSR